MLLLVTLGYSNTASRITEHTKVFHGEQEAMRILLQTMANVKKEVVICTDANSPAFSMVVEPIKRQYEDFKKRGVKVRFIIEITSENLTCIKELLKHAEVRHLGSVKGNMAVSETEYVATAILQGAKPITQTIFSNVKAILQQQQYFFESLWSKAIPAEERIKEIEENRPPEKTEVAHGIEKASSLITQWFDNTKQKEDILVDKNWFSVATEVELYNKSFCSMKERGIKFRIISEITKENIFYCKKVMEWADEVRHIDNAKGNFGISEREYIAVTEVLKQAEPATHVLLSNVQPILIHLQYMFDNLLEKAIPAEQKIREIEEGIESEFVEVITDGYKAATLGVDFVKSVRKEAQLILPHARTVLRFNKSGIWDALINAANNYGAKIRVISPIDDENQEEVKAILNRAPNIKILAGPYSTSGLIIQDDIRYMRVENKSSESTSDNIEEVVDRIIYSNSRNGVISFKDIFETIWKQGELYEKLSAANEKLTLHDKMQQEFINIAAHELRTPIQPILGIASMLEEEIRGREKIEVTKEDISIVLRNAARLERLSSDILTVSRIEGQSLKLNKELVNMQEKICNVILDIKSYIKKGQDLEIVFESEDDDEEPIIVEADRLKLFEVLSNLLRNAIKFTEHGTIEVSSRLHDRHAVVTIKDTGIGIDAQIMPRLFEKFTTNSESGTGLGLFISKSIIEAHGGKIWAENNKDGRGATFAFSLPASKI